MSQQEKLSQIKLKEDLYTELVNEELKKLFKVTYKHNWDNIRKKAIELTEGEVDGSSKPGQSGPVKVIDG